MNAITLPNDIDSLKKIIIQGYAQSLVKDKNIQSKEKEIKSKEKEIKHLEDIINLLQRKKYAPQSEIISSKQLNLFNELEDIKAEFEEENEEKETITYERRKKRRSRIPDYLPRVDHVIDLEEKEKFCPHDGSPLEQMGEEVSEQLEIIPGESSG